MEEREPQITNVRLTVDGKDCGGCERNIEFALATVEGVVRSKADHTARSLALSFDPSVTNEAEIRRVIEEIGYRVSS
ncbi:MAG: heavy-metal-associated domain-containing protein [Actinomycetota bacterium]